MPDTLSTFQQAMGLIPDNTSRLIEPDDQRSVAISLMADRGAAFSVVPASIPMPVINTYVDIPIGMTGMTQGESLFWRMDANGHLFYNYAADWPTVVVPPGHIRSVWLTGVVDFDPDGSTWQFAFTIAGVIQPPEFTIETSVQTDAITAVVVADEPIDVSAAPPVSLAARNLSNTNPLNINLVTLRTRGGPLA